MTTTYKILGQEYIGLTSYEVPGNGGYGYYYGGGGESTFVEELLPVTVYTVPNGKQAIISSIYVVNHDTISRTYDLAIVPDAETLSMKHHVKWDHEVASNDFDLTSSKYTLSQGDKVIILPSTADKIGITIFGLEIA